MAEDTGLRRRHVADSIAWTMASTPVAAVSGTGRDNGEKRVEQGEVEPQALSPGPQLALSRAEDRGACHLGPGSGSGWHGDLGKSAGRHRRFAEGEGHRVPAVRCKAGGKLGGIERRTAAHGNEAGCAPRPGLFGDGIDRPGRRIAGDVAEHAAAMPGLAEDSGGALGEAVAGVNGVRHEEDPGAVTGKTPDITAEFRQAIVAECQRYRCRKT